MRQVEGRGPRLTYKLEVRQSGLGTGPPEDGTSRRCKNLGQWVKLANVLEDREDWQVRFSEEEGALCMGTGAQWKCQASIGSC